MKLSYEILRRSTTFIAYGPSPETLLSRHKSIDSAREAFNQTIGHCVLVEIYGTQRTVIDASLI